MAADTHLAKYILSIAYNDQPTSQTRRRKLPLTRKNLQRAIWFSPTSVERNCVQNHRWTHEIPFDDEQVGTYRFLRKTRHCQEGETSPKIRLFCREGQVRLCEEGNPHDPLYPPNEQYQEP